MKESRLSQTLRNKTLSSGLGKTLMSLKVSQEALQTAVAAMPDRSHTAAFRIAKLQEHGRGSLAYSSLQSGMKYFMHDTLGYIAYVPLRDGPNSVCVLSDPICSKQNTRALLEAFMVVRKDPIFLHIDKDTAAILNEKGFSVNELGVETIIDIQKFALTGNKKQQLRSARNHGKKDGLIIKELQQVDDQALQSFKKISDDWHQEKVINDSEMQFLVRPIVYVDEVDVRKFVAIKDGVTVGFVIFDPMYRDGRIVGYIANHLRSNLDRSYSVVDCIILDALDIFKSEGKESLSLGLCPMAKIDDGDQFKHDKLLKAHFRYAYEKANYLYNFKNLHYHKSKYRPELEGAREEKIYCAMRTRFMLVRIYDVYRVLGLNPVGQTVKHIKANLISGVKQLFAKKAEPAIETKSSVHQKPSDRQQQKLQGTAGAHQSLKQEQIQEQEQK